jgi:uncharacterized protein (TIGR03435 family)
MSVSNSIRWAGIALVVTPTILVTLAGQSAAPLQFEVASIKPNKSGDKNARMTTQPGGRYVATNVPLRLLILHAYGLTDSQLTGGQAWVSSDQFDITAKGEGEFQSISLTPSSETTRLQLMLRALLADRFKLVLRGESRDVPTYALVLARPDGKLGPKLQPSTTDCAARMAARRAGQPPSKPPVGFGVVCGMRTSPGNIAGGDITMEQVVGSLSGPLQRIVLDRTGLTGRFIVDLSWTPDPTPQGLDRNTAPAAIELSGPSLFTAVQEQLGLRLESTRMPIKVMVIDRLEQPTPD